MGTGQSMAAPTDMSQIKVPQMPIDPASVPAATGANAAAKLPQMIENAPKSSGLLDAMAMGGLAALGGGGGQEQPAPMVQAAPFRGSALFQNPGAESFSNHRVGAPNLRGLLNG